MKRKFLGLVGILFLTLACGLITPATPAQPGVETIVAATFQALTAAAPATQTPYEASGTTITVNNISFVIPTKIGNGAQAETIEAVPPSNDAPWWDIAPAYNKYLIQGYPLSNTFHEPAIYVYPVDEYVQSIDVIEKVGIRFYFFLHHFIEHRINGLLLFSPELLLVPLLHKVLLPTFNAAQVFHSNEQVQKFQNGTGIRFLTQYAQAPYPVNNNSLFYTFQGLTNDGAYYISAILPINAAFLSPDGNPNTPLPADGVPFDWNNFENIPAHFELVKQKLNATDPNAFTPSLTNLDTMIQSVRITGTP